MRVCNNCNFITKDDDRLTCPDCGEKTSEMSDEHLELYRKELETRAQFAMQTVKRRDAAIIDVERTPFSVICAVILILAAAGFVGGLLVSGDYFTGTIPTCVALAANGACCWPLLFPESFARRLTTFDNKDIDHKFMSHIFAAAFVCAVIIDIILAAMWAYLPR